MKPSRTQGLEEKKRILRARARELARIPEEGRSPEDAVTVLAFRLANESYAVETAYVREVCSVPGITSLPGTPSFVVGIVNVRGRIHSVVDLKRFFDIPAGGLGDLNRLVILRSQSMEFGILADAIIGIRSLEISDLQRPLPTQAGICEEYLKGITAERLALLDAGKLLSDARIVVRQEA